jgi:hypothetical protein
MAPSNSGSRARFVICNLYIQPCRLSPTVVAYRLQPIVGLRSVIDPTTQSLVPNRESQDTVTLGVTAWFRRRRPMLDLLAMIRFFDRL